MKDLGKEHQKLRDILQDFCSGNGEERGLAESEKSAIAKDLVHPNSEDSPLVAYIRGCLRSYDMGLISDKELAEMVAGRILS